MKNYVQRGETVTVTAPYAVLSGGGILVAGTGHIFGVAVNNQSSGDSTEVLTEGVFDLTKDTSTFAEGDYVYWNNSLQECTSTAMRDDWPVHVTQRDHASSRLHAA